MNASPKMLAAFEAWKLAELASHYASPCPEDVMQDLVDRASNLFDALMDLPPANADDMLLKLFPVLLHEWEPRAGEPPMMPARSRSYTYPDSMRLALINDLGVRSPAIATAMRASVNPIYEETARA